MLYHSLTITKWEAGASNPRSINMRKIHIGQIFTFLLLLPLHITFAQQLDFELEVVFAIGGNEDDSEEYLFISPQQIFSDSQNNIYLRDVVSVWGHQSKEIRKYSPQGDYLSPIGQTGQGPGEFQSMVCFCINDKDQILIYDEINRRLTLFDSDCINFEMLRISSDFLLKPQFMLPFTSNSYLVMNYMSSDEITNLFYVYSEDFTKLIEKFGNAHKIWDQNVALLRHEKSSGSANFTIVDSTKIFLTPELYDGKIFFFDKKETKWETKTIKGKKPKFKSFKEVPHSWVGKRKLGKLARTFGEKGKKYGYTISNQSAGIFTYGVNHIIHFSVLDDDDGNYLFVAELYTTNGKYKGHVILEKLNRISSLIKTKVIGKDNAGYFYLTELLDDFPVIKKIRIKIDI